MIDRLMADLLAATYYHTVSAWRPNLEGGETVLCREAPCALSRSAMTNAPAPPEDGAALPEASYRLNLFTRPGTFFRLGDRVEVRDGTGRVWHGRTSDSFRYPSHCVTVVEVYEVEDAPESPAGGTGTVSTAALERGVRA